MKSRQFINKLTVITISVLTGIVALQVYWLLASYQQQKDHFKADIENALLSANTKITLRKMLGAQHNDLLSALDMSALYDEISDDKHIVKGLNKRVVALQLSDADIHIADTQKLLSALKKMIDSNTIFEPKVEISRDQNVNFTMKDLVGLKSVYKKELAARAITIPFELAVTDTAGSVHLASCDTGAFRYIPVKSEINGIPGGGAGLGIQAAFPHTNIYLLRRMFWILLVTGMLILIGAYSLGYLLILFFRQKRIAEIRTDFMNNMTHELKTPISSVSVALEMVLDDQRNLSADRKRSYLLIAQKELGRLNGLVENALRIVSLERAEVTIQVETVMAKPLIAEVIDGMVPLIEQKKAGIEVEVIPEDLQVTADRVHLTNVLHNIIENALKYNDKASPRIRLNAGESPGIGTVICISDNGEGIPGRHLDKIFDKFFRVPKGDLHDIKGFGLGLSYVKRIIDMHKGHISVKSVPGEGSEFIISLPKK